MNRYARQAAVRGFGAEAQARLRAARVLVIGAGGLAAPLLPVLAGAGVGQLRICDADRVEISNLHRQTLFGEADVGRAKVHAAALRLSGLNREVAIEPVAAMFGPHNAEALCDGVDLVIDCADSFAASYVASDLCAARGWPFVTASVGGASGYALACCGGAPSLRAVFPDLPERLGSCAEDGVLGPVVATIGGVQAQMALSILAGAGPSPLGRLVSFDAGTWRMGGFGFGAAPEPAPGPRFIDAREIGPEDFVVDLRRPEEGPIACAGARRLAVSEFGGGGPRPAPGQRAVLCCRSGLRAWSAAARLSAVWDGEITLVALGDPTGETA
ncbi:ThiF family adenylyltransferase [Limimaricola sp.]|uniref:ThiF family adenylyltransferase n=1 Tax=Limimaricola sp. TaxID=2211665 RepID=UPI004059C28A